jgi:hypothetical protein
VFSTEKSGKLSRSSHCRLRIAAAATGGREERATAASKRKEEEDPAARTAKIRRDQHAKIRHDKACAGSSSAHGTAKQIQRPVHLLQKERQQHQQQPQNHDRDNPFPHRPASPPPCSREASQGQRSPSGAVAKATCPMAFNLFLLWQMIARRPFFLHFVQVSAFAGQFCLCS